MNIQLKRTFIGHPLCAENSVVLSAVRNRMSKEWLKAPSGKNSSLLSAYSGSVRALSALTEVGVVFPMNTFCTLD